MEPAALREKFYELFGHGAVPQAVRAPGRVNLIGEHTDYNDGFVLPIAIEAQMLALVRPRGDRQIVLRSVDSPDAAQIDLDAPIQPGEPQWANYSRGVAAGLRDLKLPLVGAEILFASTIPLGAGLSSSAALEVATALALEVAGGFLGQISHRQLALLCQHAEHVYANAPCGIMDQSIVIMAQSGHALLLDCRNGQTRQVPFDDPHTTLLVCDTQVKHSISDGGYAARRAQCESAAKKLKVRALRDATMELLDANETLTDLERRRARHVIGEIQRTLAAVTALEARDYALFGQLMYQSHESLAGSYDVSCEELDAIVEAARPLPGVYGARMTGGGFGGCAIVLANAARAQDISRAIGDAFHARFGRRCPVFATGAAPGASVLTI